MNRYTAQHYDLSHDLAFFLLSDPPDPRIIRSARGYNCHSRITTVHTIINFYIVIPYLLVLFIICVFCSVTVILLRRGSFGQEKKFNV